MSAPSNAAAPNAAAPNAATVYVIIKTTSRNDAGQILHTVRAFRNRQMFMAENRRLEQQEDDGEIMSADSVSFDNLQNDTSVPWVVFHYHDNYADVIKAFDTEEEARAYYEEKKAGIEEDMRQFRYDREGAYIEEEDLGNQIMTTMYDSEGRYPDKGSRWVLTNARIDVITGGKRRKTRRGRKARRITRSRR